jgi:hypothetical protein
MFEKEKPDGFHLEGSSHEKPESNFIQDKIEQGKRRPRLTIAILSALAMVLFIWAAISQYQMQQNKKLVKEAADIKAVYDSNRDGVEYKQHIIDSLQNEILKLQKDNDILAENTPNQDGIFFEVQIGSFTDFNMNQYLENLANLRQERHNNKTKFLLGRFRSFAKAIKFESDLKVMGIRSAYLVGRIDGKLVSYQEALEAGGQGNN